MKVKKCNKMCFLRGKLYFGPIFTMKSMTKYKSVNSFIQGKNLQEINI